MIIKTRIFDLAANRFDNLSDLAGAMGLSVSQVYRVREGKRSINHKFIIGAKKAFPDVRLDDLFYFEEDKKNKRKRTNVNDQYVYIVRKLKASEVVEANN